MIKVLKSELRKYTRSLAIYICMAIMVLVPTVEYIFMAVSSKGTSQVEETQKLMEQFLAANGDQIFVYLYTLLFHGGSIFIVATVMAGIIVAEDSSNGTLKYIMLLSSRTKMALGKVGILLLSSTILNFMGLIVPIVISAKVREIYFETYTMSHLIAYVVIGWSTITAFTLLVGLIGSITNNVPATIGIGLGVYLVSAGFGGHLPSVIQKFWFVMNIVKFGEKNFSELFFSVGISCFMILILSIVLGMRLRKKEY